MRLILAGLGFSTEVVQVIEPTLMIFMVLISVAITIMILMQEGNTNNITGISGKSEDTFYGKNKTKNRESKLKRATLILSICLLVISVLFFLFKLQ